MGKFICACLEEGISFQPFQQRRHPDRRIQPAPGVAARLLDNEQPVFPRRRHLVCASSPAPAELEEHLLRILGLSMDFNHFDIPDNDRVDLRLLASSREEEKYLVDSHVHGEAVHRIDARLRAEEILRPTRVVPVSILRHYHECAVSIGYG